MNFFRTQITRFTCSFLLLAGMAFYFVKPAIKKVRYEAFSSWLGSHLISHDKSQILAQVNALSSFDGEMESVIRKASELVTNHTQDFEFPITNKNTESTDDVFRLLLTEWNYFQLSSSGMGKAVHAENMKPQTVISSDKHIFIKGTTSAWYKGEILAEARLSDVVSPDAYLTLSPLKSGISIGAP